VMQRGPMAPFSPIRGGYLDADNDTLRIVVGNALRPSLNLVGELALHDRNADRLFSAASASQILQSDRNLRDK
jgi:hypothetical protein